MDRSLVNAANLFILALLVGASMFVFDQLPERIPVHFGGDGQPDRWAERSWMTWMLLPAISVALTGMMYGIAALVARHPKHVNVPNQKLYERLPLQAKQRVLETQVDLMAWITLGMNLMMCAIQGGSYETATGASDGLPFYVLVAIIGFVVFTGVVAVRAITSSSRLIKELAAEYLEDD